MTSSTPSKPGIIEATSLMSTGSFSGYPVARDHFGAHAASAGKESNMMTLRIAVEHSILVSNQSTSSCKLCNR